MCVSFFMILWWQTNIDSAASRHFGKEGVRLRRPPRMGHGNSTRARTAGIVGEAGRGRQKAATRQRRGSSSRDKPHQKRPRWEEEAPVVLDWNWQPQFTMDWTDRWTDVGRTSNERPHRWKEKETKECTQVAISSSNVFWFSHLSWLSLTKSYSNSIN